MRATQSARVATILRSIALMTVAPRSSIDLCATDYVVSLDIGREQNTWMPPQWCASGTRIALPLAVRFEPDGRAVCVGKGAYFDETELSSGRFAVEGAWPNNLVRFDLECTSGYTRGDNALPAKTVIFFAVSFLGATPSKREGILSVVQRRLVVRKERRMIGTFTMAPRAADEPLPPSRVYFDKRWVS